MASAPSDLVIGVAGHIDHGKTALVRALTGIDTDRLPEEKARGITIELGFAHLVLPNGRRAAVIDMPGHERFVRAMIAGAGGVDLVLLVVAANEGVMPQTREHLAIAELVGVRGGVVALSKADLASDEIIELAREEVREVLAGTLLANAEIVPVSAHARRGLDELQTALARASVPPREATGPVLVPIDRVFVRKGFGAVITGTLVSGTLREGDALVIAPVGVDAAAREVRVRGLQIHGESVTEARAGTRVAVNVAGLEAAEIPRGAWLFAKHAVALSQSFDARVHTLGSTHKPLGRRTRLEIAVGAAHATATVALLEGEELSPGGTLLARITADAPLALRPGERFVLRGPPSLAGVGSTVGGGVVVRPLAERARKRDVALARAQKVVASESAPADRARVEVESAGARGLSGSDVLARTGFRVDASNAAATELAPIGADRFVAVAVIDAAGQRMLHALSNHHAQQAAARGLERRALRGAMDEPLFDTVLARLVAQKKIETDGEIVFRAGWRPKDPDAVPHLGEVARAIAGAGLTAPRPEEIAASLKADAKALEPALKRLVERGSVVRVNNELYVSAPAMTDLEKRLVAWLEQRGTIDAQGFKELTGASRKWTIPLAEHFDNKRVTLRIGDVRKLRGR